MYLSVDVDLDEVLAEIETKDLIAEIKARGQRPHPLGGAGDILIKVHTLADVGRVTSVLDAAGIQYTEL